MSWPRPPHPPLPRSEVPALVPGMIGSKWDYDYLMAQNREVGAQTFHTLIMAAMIRADSDTRRRLAAACPDVAADMLARGHLELDTRHMMYPDDARQLGCDGCGCIVFLHYYDPASMGTGYTCANCGTAALQ